MRIFGRDAIVTTVPGVNFHLGRLFHAHCRSAPSASFRNGCAPDPSQRPRFSGMKYYNMLRSSLEKNPMQNVERLSITLPVDMARLIRAKVEEGGYASNSEVIREAMRAWQEQEQLRAQRLAAVRAKIAEADAETALPLSDAEVDRHFAERLARSLAIRATPEDHA
jgi:antitoxin ParD1/3/4